ncbi:malonyl-coenzyme A:anthocyanin 3-O-glucoside-6''-O-malonyltransferase-like [Apium graveolens]|uniref:malonyl-coenzyme A:anthocyanin 3-O-glucoside-6''-O-malonyltransferase-like n=1 Tax=Apium graveolens TaxID=4045 RepID=UPI003D790554
MSNAAGTNIVTVLEHCRISPPHDPSLTETFLPLTLFDMLWLNWPSPGRVYFYDFPCSTTEFKQTLVPHLKNSLALTLKHFYPFCGNVITATSLSDRTTPAIRYLNGDSVSLTVAEFSGTNSEGFDHLSGNHARGVDELFALVPELSRGGTETDVGNNIHISPVLSVQVTLFPDQGYSIGYRISHVVADGKTLSNFIRTWASINVKQLNGENDFDNLETLPFYDRSVIKDPKGIASIFLQYSLRTRLQKDYEKAFAPAADKNTLVDATIILDREQIQGLKNSVSDQVPRVSTFVVVCAYVWTCMAKTRAALGQDMNNGNQVEEHFIFAMDARDRLDPPIPSNYFGNTIVPCWATQKTSQLVGEKGFANAVEAIRNALYEKINNDEGPLKGLEMYFDRNEATKGQVKFGVAGSPKFNYYNADFGWGKPKKYEIVSEKFGLIGSNESEGGLELGFCFSKMEMDVFTAIFTQGLLD